MMTDQTRRLSRVVGFAGLVAGVFVGLVAGPPARPASAADSPGYAKPPDGAKFELVGAAVCQNCHDEEDPTKKALYKQTLGYDFIRLWENRVWGVHDLHSRAAKNLLTARTVKGKAVANRVAQVMEDNLRQAYQNDKYTAVADVNCLACHASTKAPHHQLPPADWKAASFSTTDGVGCEMCHGHGSQYQTKHQESREVDPPAADGATRVVDWRTWSPAEKKSLGLVDLRDPAVATDRCASCHVGNRGEGRFVTHVMFAAGHPPLPPLDLVAYAREQPRHWGLSAEMPYLKFLAGNQRLNNAGQEDARKAEEKQRDKDLAWAAFHYRGGEQVATRRFAESAVASLRSSLLLTSQLAADAKKAGGGLDYAAFDCSSCHHDLKYPSDRQVRGYDGPPGRPQFRATPFALARIVVDHAAGMEGGKALFDGEAAKVDDLRRELAFTFGPSTFGNPDAIRPVAEKIHDWAGQTLKKLAGVTYTEAETRKLLAKVVEAARREPAADPKGGSTLTRAVADPEVAQVYHWAVETLTLDLGPKVSDPTKQPPPPPELAVLRKALDPIVVTRLRPGAAFYYEQPANGGVPAPTLQSVDERLADRMKSFNAFQGEPFRAGFMAFSAPK